jgi:hypothetical protein
VPAIVGIKNLLRVLRVGVISADINGPGVDATISVRSKANSIAHVPLFPGMLVATDGSSRPLTLWEEDTSGKTEH